MLYNLVLKIAQIYADIYDVTSIQKKHDVSYCQYACIKILFYHIYIAR